MRDYSLEPLADGAILYENDCRNPLQLVVFELLMGVHRICLFYHEIDDICNLPLDGVRPLQTMHPG
jgi:hypothetical protein